ncbi:hypothetical protein GCM10020001_013330 [Nonomuraea salmonea]
MTVNGEPRLTCGTFLTEYGEGPVRIEPLKGFPVIRDLVVDIDGFLAKLSSVRPWLIRQGEEPPLTAEYAQTPEQLEAYKQYSMCINCLLCYSACPVYVLDPDFLGPAAIALAQRYNLDSRDMGDRFDVLSQDDAVWGVHVRRRVHEGLPEARGPGGGDPALQTDGGAALGAALEQEMKAGEEVPRPSTGPGATGCGSPAAAATRCSCCAS